MNAITSHERLMNRAKNIFRANKNPNMYDSILDTVGNTPIVKLNNIAPGHVEIYAKLESFNPMGSVKDRLAKAVIEDGERSGALKPGQTVIEATSGNTGIGLALVCAAKGYPLVVVMAESFSVERRRLMRFLGAKVILTPAALKGTGMIKKAKELAEKHGWFMTRQFDNPANARTHHDNTAQEIIDSFEGIELDYWVSGFGTGGTLNGVASRLKKDMPNTKIIAAEPDNSPLLSSGKKQVRNAAGDPSESHPMFRPHVMQGWSPDFISKLTEDASDADLIDGFEMINGDKAMEMSRKLAQKEGIFVGVTAGATMAGAMQIAETAPAGTRILVMLPDTGERYLSTPLFDGIEDEMSQDEVEISRSTKSARFDSVVEDQEEPKEEIAAASENTDSTEIKTSPAVIEVTMPTPMAYVSKLKPADVYMGQDAETFVETVINDPHTPVAVFGLAWCEYGWSVKKFLNSIDASYHDIQIDRPEFHAEDMTNQVRSYLESITGACTFPQVFINGKFVGGCTEVFDTFKEGVLQETLTTAGVGFIPASSKDPYEMLPSWVHSRS